MQCVNYKREGRGASLEAEILRKYRVAPVAMALQIDPCGNIPMSPGRASDMQGAWITIQSKRILTLMEALQLMGPELDNLRPDKLYGTGPWN